MSCWWLGHGGGGEQSREAVLVVHDSDSDLEHQSVPRNNSPSPDYCCLDNSTRQRTEIPGLKPFTTFI